MNRFVDQAPAAPELFPADPKLGAAQVERVQKLKANREGDAVAVALRDLEAAARGTQNLLVPMRAALAARATLGEVADVLREVFGVYRPG